MKRESTVVELNETPRSSGRQKERKSRDRVFIRAATVEKRENDSQCRSTRSTFTRCDGEERKRFRLKWFRDGSKSWSEKKKFFSLSEKYWGIKILQCVCMYASFLKYYSFDNIIKFYALMHSGVNGINIVAISEMKIWCVKIKGIELCRKRLIRRFIWLENINCKITIERYFKVQIKRDKKIKMPRDFIFR